MAREGVSPVEIASPPAAEREARRGSGSGPRTVVDGVSGRVGVRAPPEAEERAAPRADHERERVDDDDDRPEADWDDVLERLARVDRDLDTFVARRETRDVLAVSDPAGRATAADTNATERELESIEREPAAASRAFVARLAASMTSSLEGDASAEETRAARAEAVAAVEAFYDALLRTRPEKQDRESRTSPMHRALETAGGDVFATSSRGDDSVANLLRVLETL